MSIHAEWLSLIEVSGAFLVEPVLDQVFPQGLEGLEPAKKQAFRQTYEEWREALDTGDKLQPELQSEWINWVLKTGLEWDEDDEGNELKAGSDVPPDLKVELLEHNLTLKPDYVLFANDIKKPYFLVSSYPAHINLNNVFTGDGWSTTPAERMSQLCRGTGTRLGLVTNGEQWMVVDAPEGGTTSYASWYARLWSQEPVTLTAFYSLINISTVFNGFGIEARKLVDLLDDSLNHQDEVTDTLGAQVQRAVEVLIQSLDRINNDSNGELLEGVAPPELYEAGLTYMMRLVFLLCAEERGLLLLGDETYEANYAVSTLRMKLREEAGVYGEEVLSYRSNAWARLLAVFRAVYGGVEHEGMRMPALGGSLFDPDRFPFLEGRSKESKWKVDSARPLPIDNRTVLLFLEAIQIYQGRTLSYLALNVEQIGYVYEGLLERTVIRSSDVTLELNSTKSSKKPWLLLGELESAKLDGMAALKELLIERTGSSSSRVTNDLAKAVTETESETLLLACQNDPELRQRIKPYYHFLRTDSWGIPLLYPKDAFMISAGADRRETGTHYTPKSLTRTIVQETLEPIVYIGASEGHDRSGWILKSPSELLDLKICDPAMGSGAFLVQACRYLSERLVEAWGTYELEKQSDNIEGIGTDFSNDPSVSNLDLEERIIAARRLVCERCLYGVDVNPLAVELAKLSLWLVTLAKDRPFGFLDHNLKSGNSLLGITSFEQLYFLDMKPTQMREGGGVNKQLFSDEIQKAVSDAVELRLEMRKRLIFDIQDVEVMAHLDQQAREKLELSEIIADSLVGESLKACGKSIDSTRLSLYAASAFDGCSDAIHSLKNIAETGLNVELPLRKKKRKAFHWCLEFPEVFHTDAYGFDAFVGNPPFLGGRKIRGVLGGSILEYLTNTTVSHSSGNADLCAFFLLRAYGLTNNTGFVGFIATNSISEGDTRETGIQSVVASGANVIFADSNALWPGVAAITVTLIVVSKIEYCGNKRLNGEVVDYISPSLKTISIAELVSPIDENKELCFQGSVLAGKGFVLTVEQAENLIADNPALQNIIIPYYTGEEIFNSSKIKPKRMVINFFDMSLELAKDYPEALNILVEKVKPKRDKVRRKAHREKWWQFGDKRPALYKKISTLDRVIVQTRHTKHLCPQFMGTGPVFSDSTVVFPTDSTWLYAVLNSFVHDAWARETSGTIRTELRYSHTDCFYTFPLPSDDPELGSLGAILEQKREDLRGRRDISINAVMDLLNDPTFCDADLDELREIHEKIDRRIITLYGWDDLMVDHDFYVVGERIRFYLTEQCVVEIKSRLLDLNLLKSAENEAIYKSKVLERKELSDPKLIKPQPDLFG